MSSRMINILLFVLASPALFVQFLRRLLRRYRYFRMRYATHTQCRFCGAEVSMVNIWACRCGFQAPAHILEECPVCHSRARILRCTECGVTTLLPEP